ncbi:MAG TPA: rod shape-determining protein MreC, partial [Methylophilaceae bacterium]|nr:rod shape-determining protein MreC [Methylophilaceae bacterium]
IDGVYPVGLAVAEVVLIERNPDSPFAHIVSRPIGGIENNRQILLLSIPKIETSVGKVVNAPKTIAVEPKKLALPVSPHAAH